MDGGTTLVHPREHLLVPPNHGNDHTAPEFVELCVIHAEARPHLGETRIPLILRQQRQIEAELADQ